ncbi:S24/S26 family peptidase [bacterium]|nr:S24/S26 family peptidase [bacterium]
MNDSSFVRCGGERRLSNFEQLELLRALTERGKKLRTQVRGFSMAPFIRDGDIITVSAINGGALKVGDVVAFTQPDSGRLAVHRIVARKGPDWFVRGDNSLAEDGIITNEQLVGCVTTVERDGRRIRFGLGSERWIIARLARHDLLQPMIKTIQMPRRLAWVILRRLHHGRLNMLISKMIELKKSDS